MTTEPRILFMLVLCAPWLALSGCEGPVEMQAPASLEAPDTVLIVRVGLEAEAQRKLGLAVAPLAAATYEERIEGQGTVVDPQPVIELMANWTIAEAAARQSRAARERAAALFDADAAGSREALESAERQAAADSAALDVARGRATVAYGTGAPWLDASQRARRMAELRDGDAVLFRASFPGRRFSELPTELVLRPLGAASDVEQRVVTELWFAPADPGVPGSVLLAYVSPAGRLVTGARLGATVATGSEIDGVLVPTSAVVIAGGNAWCYRALEDDTFLRTAVDLDRPLGSGYFQSRGFAAGEDVVIAGAGLLLAHELSGIEEQD